MGIVRNKSHSALKINFRRVGLFAIFCLMLTGCEATRETVCRDLPEFKEQMASVRLELQPRAVLQTKQGRKLASLTGTQPDEPSEPELKHWFRFAEKSLKQVQSGRDVFERDSVNRKVLKPMSEASLSLVSFHGYVGQKKWRKAFLELEKVEGQMRKVETLACTANASLAK